MFPAVERTDVTPETLATFTSESPFMALGVDLLREATSYVCISSCIMGSEPTWGRDQAIIGGHAVRLYKLLSAFLDQVCQRRRETADILSRLIFETSVNARYLLKNWSTHLADDYIRHSLRHERKLFDEITSNIADRAGLVLPIEKRMLQSIQRSARIAGVSLESIDLKEKAPWGGKHLAHKAKDVGWLSAYDAVFGGMSHFVHGSWQDLYAHQLSAVDDTHFRPELDWSRPRPQPVFVLGRLALQVAAEVAQFLGGELALDELNVRFQDLDGRIEVVDGAHEAYLSRKAYPEI